MDEAQVYRSEAPAAKTQKRRRFLKKLIRLATLGHYDGNSLDYLRWSTKFALKHAWRIITVSAATKDDILKNYPWAQASKIVVVHNGFPAELFNGERDPERIAAVAQRYNLTAPYYLYVGRLEKKKNTPALIEALSIVRSDYPEIKESLVLIGNASYGYDEVKYTIEEFNLLRDVSMPGWVEETDLPYIFQGASAFIFPTRHEGFGIPVLQALACGIPTAVSDIPVLHEVAGEAVLYFDPNDKRAMAQAMARLVSDQELRQQLIARGRERAQLFSWEKCAAATLKVIENRL
jgi:glycosyltransferase involved in cell wall biosynthesis